MLGISLDYPTYLARLQSELARVDPAEVTHLTELLYAAWESGNTVFIVGNGGSACTASHLCEDLGKGCLPTGRPVRRVAAATAGAEPHRQCRLADGDRQRLRLRPDLRAAIDEFRQAGRPAGGDQRIGQQPQCPGRRRLGQPPWADDLRHDRLQRRQAQADGPRGHPRAAGRHGHGRERPHLRDPLDRRRHARPHEFQRPLRPCGKRAKCSKLRSSSGPGRRG